MTVNGVARPAKALVPRSVALVLSGGGARGAYEVGVLSYLYNELARFLGRPPGIDVLCGTSVGAINACYLAAHMAAPGPGTRRLVDLWTSLQFERVLRFGVLEALRLPGVLKGGGSSGIFNVEPMVDLIQKEISWRLVARSLRKGHLRALSVSATEIATGRTTLFIDTAPDVPLPTGFGPRVVVKRDVVGPQHALASAAIPLVFPPVPIGSMLYCDGGLRQNTPMSPAIRLGAERVLVIGLSRELQGYVSPDRIQDGVKTTPGALFLLGKVLNAFLLDHVEADVELLRRINQLLADGTAAFGADFVSKLSATALARGGETWREVKTLEVRPSQDIGRLAFQHVRKGRFSGSMLTRRLLTLLDTGVTEESDLASYLLFDGGFARKLIDLGRADAEAQRDRLVEFLSR